MGCETKTWLILSLLLLGASYMQQCVYGAPQVPCLFVFGDSLSDSGNNNDLITTAKVNYKPYGIDFPTGPTGRFTNGLTSIDIIGQLLGLDFIPPFASLAGWDILKGVNYASGSAGIRYETGKKTGDNVGLGTQLRRHEMIIAQIAIKLGGVAQASQYLNKCLYYVNIGSNDFIDNYFLPKLYATSRRYNLEQYAGVLIDELSKSIQKLHDNGARKMVLVGTGPIGCTPNALAKNGVCVKEKNAAALIFSSKLKSLVDQLNIQFKDSKFVFRNSSADTFDGSKGFKVLNKACCQSSLNVFCTLNRTPCQNRKEYKFWDGFHPTQAANQIGAINSYNSSNPKIIYPMNIQQLVKA